MGTHFSPVPERLWLDIKMEPITNPFTITKAVDFSDREINDYWVDFPSGGGMVDISKPYSPMPMLILGGKGSGKTHLMRYYSYPVQKIRHGSDILGGIRKDGYLGIYLRCGGLNASRFKEKGQQSSLWVDLFAYYMELWLGQLFISVLKDIALYSQSLSQRESVVCEEILSLFDTSYDPVNFVKFDQLLSLLRKLQRDFDKEVNNCGLTCKLNVEIKVTRGSLIFGVPRVVSSLADELSSCLFLYLIDEFENLSAEQQKYINTLIREKESPSTFKIGAKLYGLRTFSTYSADEENKEGSEFQTVYLDELLRNNPNYPAFAKHLVSKRLSDYLRLTERTSGLDSISNILESSFDVHGSALSSCDETSFVTDKYADDERPYLLSLKDKLLKGFESKATPGISSTTDITAILSNLAVPSHPLLEKLNILLFYQDWYSNKDLLRSSKIISNDCKLFLLQKTGASTYNTALGHYKNDLFSQLLRQFNQKQRYLGIESFILMSSGIPRNLLVLLKHIVAWSLFYGEHPFRGDPISVRAQQSGVLEAAEWFYREGRAIGGDGPLLQDSISRLGELFRSIRFSDKPVECSCSTFSCDGTRISEEAFRLLDLAQQWSLLINVGGQKDRNSKRVDLKLQLNPMLCPRYDLSIARRGVIPLRPEEVNAIFDPEYTSVLPKFIKARVERMTAPFFGKKKGLSTTKGPKQLSINPLSGDIYE
jgi:hypothetical protein